jgi:S-formylglutathione hydrolase FrmB
MGEDEYFLPMEKVVFDERSPTGVYVTFTYESATAERVVWSGPMIVDPRDPATPGKRYEPEEYIPGRYQVGYSYELRRDMVKQPGTNTWSITIPMTAGVAAYRYIVYDKSKGWDPIPKAVVKQENFNFLTPTPPTSYRKLVFDGTGDGSGIPSVGADGREELNRRTIGKEFSPVYVPYHPKQANPVLEVRARYELPRRNPAERGTVEYKRVDAASPLFTVANDPVFGEYAGRAMSEAYIGIYLPPGYNPNRTEPYKVIYLAHGGGDDETEYVLLASIPNILDNMIARGEIEPTVVVGYPRGNSSNGVHQPYFLDKVIPYMENNYRVSKQPSGKALGGFSAGGSVMSSLWSLGHYKSFGYHMFFHTPTSAVDATAEWKKVTTDTLATGEMVPMVLTNIALFDLYLTIPTTTTTFMQTMDGLGIPADIVVVPDAHNYGAVAQAFTYHARYNLWKNKAIKQ